MASLFLILMALSHYYGRAGQFWTVYLITLFLGRLLSPLRNKPVLVHILLPETDKSLEYVSIQEKYKGKNVLKFRTPKMSELCWDLTTH